MVEGGELSSNRVPTWFIFSVQPDCHDLDVELVIKCLPREFLLKAALSLGEVRDLIAR
jgi:hypothetical protein